jgi:GT2 family glycosyltransferase
LVRRAALERLGGMDERFFFYNEDLEWGLRARKLGFKNLLVPRRVLHLGGASTPSDPRFIAEGYRGSLILSAEYYPWLHGLHRKAVWLEAQLRLHIDQNPIRRKGYRLLANWLAGGNVNKSLFL